MAIGLHSIVKLFEEDNVCVTGLRGKGKDMLFANVIARRNKPYTSNINYGGAYRAYDYDSMLSMNGNTFQNLISGDVIPFVSPLGMGEDIYLSDIGIYFPSQECSYLDKHYKGIPLYAAISRHLRDSNFHLNVQNLDRAWTKLREMSGTYIRCNWCKVLFGYVIQKITVYDRAESCQARVPQCPYRVPLLAPRESKELYRMKIIDYWISHGSVREMILIYKNKSNYDTHHFREVFEKGAYE